MKNKFVSTLNSSEAISLVNESSLLESEKNDYKKFIYNFESLDFYRNTELALSELESSKDITFPENIKKFRKILASVMYGHKVFLKFYSFSKESPRSDDLKDFWYSLSMSPVSLDGSVRQILFDSESDYAFIPIANVEDEKISGCYLSINAKNNDENIYEFNILDVFDTQSEGESIIQSVYPVFDSYPQMLAHISEIKYLDGNKEVIVKAQKLA